MYRKESAFWAVVLVVGILSTVLGWGLYQTLTFEPYPEATDA